MHVLILTLVFPPDNVSTARLVGHLAADLSSSGWRVSVLTTEPHYNRDPEAEARQPRRRRWPLLLEESEYHGARVLHAAMPRKGKRLLPRFFAWAGFHVISFFSGVWEVDRPDVVLAVTPPPLTIGVAAWLLGLYRGAPFVYNAQELYPDLAVTLGLVRRRRVITLLERLERFVYGRAAAITVIGPGMAERLRQKGVPDEKVRVIPNFVDVEATRPGERCNAFSREYGLDNKLVVSYAGNLGLAQGLEVVVEAARALTREPGVRFVIVGDGVLRDSLIASARESGAENCLFLPYQPHSRMAELYAASDICLVPLASATGGQAVPSKAYQVMAAGRPILALTEPGSDLAALVTAGRCGRVVRPDSADDLAAVVREALRDRAPWREMGLAGRRLAERQYSRGAVSAVYGELLSSLVEGKQPA